MIGGRLSQIVIEGASIVFASEPVGRFYRLEFTEQPSGSLPGRPSEGCAKCRTDRGQVRNRPVNPAQPSNGPLGFGYFCNRSAQEGAKRLLVRVFHYPRDADSRLMLNQFSNARDNCNRRVGKFQMEARRFAPII